MVINDISLKVWRKPKSGVWSRQSEELPIHRNIDLNILFLNSLLMSNFKNLKKSIGEEVTKTDKLREINDYYQNNKHLLESRLQELKIVLDDFLKHGI